MMTLDEAIQHCIEKSDRTECGKEHEQIAEWLEELKRFKDLHERGRLLELPCAVGDTVWDNDFRRPCAYEVTGFSYGDLNENYCENEVTAFDQVIVYYTNSSDSITGSFAVSEIGKTVFLSREEAEKALERKRE